MVRIVTDTSCDLSLEQCKKLGVEMLPITVTFGEESYRSLIDLTNEEFYQKLATVKELPTTAQITPADFQRIFTPYRESGDDVVCLFLSSRMSGTLQAATVARGMLGATNIYLPDTMNVTFALGLLVIEAVKMRDQGMTGAQINQKILELVPRVRLFASVETLTYLKMGGRLSATSAMVASVLGICPVITLKDGLVEVAGKGRGRKSTFKLIQNLIEKEPISADYAITVGYNTPENHKDFKAYMEETFKKRELYDLEIGSIVGTHIGPGAVGLAYIKK